MALLQSSIQKTFAGRLGRDRIATPQPRLANGGLRLKHQDTCSLAHSIPSIQRNIRKQSRVVCNGAPGVLSLPLDRDLEQPIDSFDSIQDALKDLAAGKFVVVIDDENRENEGDLICCADKVCLACQN